MGLKRCTKCGRELPETCFNWSDRARGRRQGMCRDCFSKYNRERYAKNRDGVRRAVREYRREHPDAVIRTRLATNARNPTKVNARRCVEAAMKAGVLVRPDHCSGCGCSDSEHRIEAHHNDYSRPLDVIWLCTPCHRRMDAQRRRREAEAAGKRGGV